MRFRAARNIAPTALVCTEFADCISFFPAGRHTSVTRYHLMLALQDVCGRIDSQKCRLLTGYCSIGFSADNWSKVGRYITAIPAGNPGTSFNLNIYENLGSDTAIASADAFHRCMLSSLGLPCDLDSKDPSDPFVQVAVLKSNTTNVMPATSRELCKFPMFAGCVWVSCFPHVGNLFFLDQLKIPSIAKLLAHAKQIALTFRSGAFRKIFLMCALLCLRSALKSGFSPQCSP
jgi:hypothetical protein